MQDMNLVVLTGGLTKDAVVRDTQNGYFYSFSIGFNKSVKDSAGNWSDKSLYRDCSFFSKSDYYSKTLKKGTKICIKGELDTSEYKDSQGNDRRRDYIKVDDIQIFNSTKKAEQKTQPKPASAPVPAPAPEPEEDYSDLPF